MNTAQNMPRRDPFEGQQTAFAPTSKVQDFADTLDIRSIVTTIWRGKWIIAICLLLAYSVGYLSISQIKPTYRANALVMFDIQQTNVVDLEGILINDGIDRDRLEDEMLVLSSNKLLRRVVDELNLYQDPEFNTRLLPPQESVVDRIREYTNIEETVWNILRDLDLVDGEFPQKEAAAPPPVVSRDILASSIVRRVKSNLSLSPEGRSRVLNISFVADDPETAAKVANTVANQYIVDQLEAKLEATRAATSWLSERVEELRIRVQNAETAVQSARAQFTEQRGQSSEITQQQLGALNKALAEARAEETRASIRYERLSAALQSEESLARETEFRQDSVMRALRDRLSLRESEFNDLADSISETNPRVVQAKRELDRMREETSQRILLEAQQIVAGAQNRLVAARQQVDALREQVSLLEATALVQAEDELGLRQLEREAQASRVLYENFLGRLQETNAQQDLQAADARVLSEAEPPSGPERRTQDRTMFLSLLFGGAIGVGIIFLLNMLNNTFRSPKQLEELTGHSVLGTIPRITARTRRLVLSHLRQNPGSSLAESVRNLRTSILMSNIDKPPQVVMFTSTVPREGKTTTSMLMAMTSRQMGKSAILVDCDLRLPAIARMLDDPGSGPGLMSVLVGESQLEDAIFTDPETGLDFLFAKSQEIDGTINAADMLSSKKFARLIEDLVKRYELIILDTPPALVVTDARILAKIVNAVVYMVHWDKTPRGAVLEGLKQLESVNAPIAGIAMSFINETKAAKYSYDGYTYYKGRYKDYYTEG